MALFCVALAFNWQVIVGESLVKTCFYFESLAGINVCTNRVTHWKTCLYDTDLNNFSPEQVNNYADWYGELTYLLRSQCQYWICMRVV